MIWTPAKPSCVEKHLKILIYDEATHVIYCTDVPGLIQHIRKKGEKCITLTIIPNNQQQVINSGILRFAKSFKAKIFFIIKYVFINILKVKDAQHHTKTS